MGEKRKLDFFLLRYVPDAVKEEFVNIGLVGLEADGSFSEVRLSSDGIVCGVWIRRLIWKSCGGWNRIFGKSCGRIRRL
jgi:hypothetical protein